MGGGGILIHMGGEVSGGCDTANYVWHIARGGRSLFVGGFLGEQRHILIIRIYARFKDNQVKDRVIRPTRATWFQN